MDKDDPTCIASPLVFPTQSPILDGGMSDGCHYSKYFHKMICQERPWLRQPNTLLHPWAVLICKSLSLASVMVGSRMFASPNPKYLLLWSSVCCKYWKLEPTHWTHGLYNFSCTDSFFSDSNTTPSQVTCHFDVTFSEPKKKIMYSFYPTRTF